MINRRRKQTEAEMDEFSPEQIINDTKKKKFDANKKLRREETERLRKEERDQLTKLFAMLEAQGELLKKLIKTDEVTHEELSAAEEKTKKSGIEELEELADDMEKKNKVDDNTELILEKIFGLKGDIDDEGNEFIAIVEYFENNWDFNLEKEREKNPNAKGDGVLLENWIREQDFGDDIREQIFDDIAEIESKDKNKFRR